MAFSFGDSPPSEFTRANKGWLKRKKTASKAATDKIKSENVGLKQRLEELEAAVNKLVSKKKK